MNRKQFEQLVQDALATIPARFRDHIENLAIVVEDEPSDELLDDMEVPPDETLYGLYQGTPLTERGASYGNALPDRITIFQGPIEDDCETEEEAVVVIGETLIHEIGHYFGMTEEELEQIEDQYWNEHAPEGFGEEEGDDDDDDDEDDEGWEEDEEEDEDDEDEDEEEEEGGNGKRGR